MVRVMAFIDGFNLYHALEYFERGTDAADKLRYKKYKWLCLTSLAKKFLVPDKEELVGVNFFTTFPTWNEAKRLRHLTYVNVQKTLGVNVILGEFKNKTIECRAACYKEFDINEEKQTDVNIATAMIDMADQYDKLILVTADSDQVPAVKLIKKLYPKKRTAVLAPIGRKSKELSGVCHETFKMLEQHLIDCQLPNPFPVIKDGKEHCAFHKPPNWP
jgi:uncharacterized LabA/DUF88 family protein